MMGRSFFSAPPLQLVAMMFLVLASSEEMDSSPSMSSPPAPPLPSASPFSGASGVYSLSMAAVSQQQPSERALIPIQVGVMLPQSTFRARANRGALRNILAQIGRARPAPSFLATHDVVATVVSIYPKPSPTAILNHLCRDFLERNVTAILLLTNYETYGRETASTQYFLQLANYLRIPVIAWNADNSGLERGTAQSSLTLQLAPTLVHQTAAMLSILQRYRWHQFAVVTSFIAGHEDFVQAVRDAVLRYQTHFKFSLLAALSVPPENPIAELKSLVESEARVMLLYCTRDEARLIMKAAEKLNLAGSGYLWIATQSVIGSSLEAPNELPIGMLGVHFATDDAQLHRQLSIALRVFTNGLEQLTKEPARLAALPQTFPKERSLGEPHCESGNSSTASQGEAFYKILRSSRLEVEGGPPIEFRSQDGSLASAQLQVLNLRPKGRLNQQQRAWSKIGVWQESVGLDIRDVVWPGGSPSPPQGVPEKFHLRITFLEEPPYVHLAPAGPNGRCPRSGVTCRIGSTNSTNQCCSGFCIDLLQKFADDLGFTYDLFRVQDGKWGAQTNGRWNGLVAALINHKADLVMTSLKINFERAQAIDFSLPFLDTGIAIVVAKRTGIISPTAFLEPFDTTMWLLVALVAIHAAAIAIFTFEWLSPRGYNRSLSRDHRFSLCRTLWLVWAVLFQAAVNVDCPRGYSARFMANVWAMFALIFLAIYTANLAAFMITREEFHDLSGINDTKLSNPYSQKPAFRFGTIPHGNTDAVLRRNFPEMHAYMRPHNRSSVLEGVAAVKEGSLDAFLYDATVLDYLAGQDADCTLLTVGSWFAMTGYGVGFPRRSRYRSLINRQLMEYRENGDLERLRRYWFTGSCNNRGKEQQSRSEPLALDQFFSTFLLLGCGVLLSCVLLLIEHCYVRPPPVKRKQSSSSALQDVAMYARTPPQQPPASRKLQLLSRSLGRSQGALSAAPASKAGQPRARLRHRQPAAHDPQTCGAIRHHLSNQLMAAQCRLAVLEEALLRHGLNRGGGPSVSQTPSTKTPPRVRHSGASVAATPSRTVLSSYFIE